MRSAALLLLANLAGCCGVDWTRHYTGPGADPRDAVVFFRAPAPACIGTGLLFGGYARETIGSFDRHPSRWRRGWVVGLGLEF